MFSVPTRTEFFWGIFYSTCASSQLGYDEYTDRMLSVVRADGKGEDWPIIDLTVLLVIYITNLYIYIDEKFSHFIPS